MLVLRVKNKNGKNCVVLTKLLFYRPIYFYLNRFHKVGLKYICDSANLIEKGQLSNTIALWYQWNWDHHVCGDRAITMNLFCDLPKSSGWEAPKLTWQWWPWLTDRLSGFRWFFVWCLKVKHRFILDYYFAEFTLFTIFLIDCD